MTGDAILSVRGLVKRFAGLLATDHVDLDLRPGEIHALIGPNGAGKSTLINQICGTLTPDAGTVLLRGQPVDRLDAAARAARGIGRTFQVVRLIDDATVMQTRCGTRCATPARRKSRIPTRNTGRSCWARPAGACARRCWS